jgi:DnaK suppressor protein
MIEAENIQKIRRQLEEELSALLGHMESWAEGDDRRDGRNLDHDDLAHNFAARERSFALRDVDNARLNQIRKALERIELGTYGKCADCGKAILAERLEIIPYATLCVSCQQARDQQ